MILRFLVVFLVALGACARASDSVPREETAGAGTEVTTGERPRIMFVGTSLTAGFGLDPDVAYPAVIGRWIDSLNLNHDVINVGSSGITSAGTLRQIGWLMQEPASVIVLETGANDGLRALSVDSLRANLHAIIDSIEHYQPGADVMLVGMEAPPNLGPAYTSRFRETFPRVARERGLRFVPFMLDGVAGVDTLNLADGIHPNEAGHRVVAANVWRELEPLMRTRDVGGDARGSGAGTP